MKNHNEISILIGANGNGSFIAASAHEPYFCFEGSSEEEVTAKASRAVSFYFASQEQGVRLPANAPKARTIRSFIPARRLRGADLALA